MAKAESRTGIYPTEWNGNLNTLHRTRCAITTIYRGVLVLSLLKEGRKVGSREIEKNGKGGKEMEIRIEV